MIQARRESSIRDSDSGIPGLVRRTHQPEQVRTHLDANPHSHRSHGLAKQSLKGLKSQSPIFDLALHHRVFALVLVVPLTLTARKPTLAMCNFLKDDWYAWEFFQKIFFHRTRDVSNHDPVHHRVSNRSETAR